ncbi:MAG: hypothetical protein IPI24_05355 [Ignavibacteria bacterium]|nr:hypothetical protein [Ignavibacteria bacterium]
MPRYLKPDVQLRASLHDRKKIMFISSLPRIKPRSVARRRCRPKLLGKAQQIGQIGSNRKLFPSAES